MVLSPEMLDNARKHAAALEQAERQAALLRTEYHTAIRRLHLAGGSLREIAQALSLSHQRVQQIVNAAGGSWWQIWRGRRGTRDAVCTWCDRPPSEVAKLIAGPKVFICDDCIAAAERQPAAAAHHRSSRRCGFCSRRANTTRAMVEGATSICSDCLRACREILDAST